MRVAVIGDSISTHNNGASLICWPSLLAQMIKDGGVKGWSVDNYSIPGLTWKTAHIPTPGWLIGGKQSPVEAMLSNGPYDLILVMMGVNDRQNPSTLDDYYAFRMAFTPSIDGGAPLAFVAEHFLLPNGQASPNGVVTTAEAQEMESIYSTIQEPFYGVNLAKLYDMGYTYDGLHPTNSGKQWIAASVYMGLQAVYPLTPITRNIAWLYDQSPEVQSQMKLANT